jgi:shikimate kinase
MKKNIAILSLNKNYSKIICKKFADELDMFFADINDMLEYSLVNKEMLNLAGKNYFDSEAQKIVFQIASCENTCIVCSFDLLNTNDNFDIIKNKCVIVYLKHSKEQLEKLSKKSGGEFEHLSLAWEVENQICNDMADIVIPASCNENADIKNIIDSVKKYFSV